jgi:uncharacterized membrane protein
MQVDVLQAIGASLLLLALAQRWLALLGRPGWLLALAAGVAAVSVPLGAWLPGKLPTPLMSYLVRVEPLPGNPATALFPLFPWLAYPLLGAALGALLKRTREQRERVIVGLACLGALGALVTSEAQPFVHRIIAAEPWLVHPIRVGFRAGIVLCLLLVGWVWCERGRGRLLIAFGQNSLRIYWAHMFFAYGVLGRALQRQTDFLSWALWLFPLFLAMWLLTRVNAASPPGPQPVAST